MTYVSRGWNPLAVVGTAASSFAQTVAVQLTVYQMMTSVDKSPSQNFSPNETCLIVGGGHGTGKAVLKAKLSEAMKEGDAPPEYIANLGSDLLKPLMRIPGFRNVAVALLVRSTESEDSFTTRVALDAASRAFGRRLPVIIDNHMDQPGFVYAVLSAAQKAGYTTAFASPYTSMQTVVHRLERRRTEKGIDYDPARVLRSHIGFASNLNDYLSAFDSGIVVDNDIATKNTALDDMSAIVAKGRRGILVLDNGKYLELQNTAKLTPDEDTIKRIFGPNIANENTLPPNSNIADRQRRVTRLFVNANLRSYGRT